MSLFSGTGFLLVYRNILCFNTNTVTFTNYFFKTSVLLHFHNISDFTKYMPYYCIILLLYCVFSIKHAVMLQKKYQLHCFYFSHFYIGNTFILSKNEKSTQPVKRRSLPYSHFILTALWININNFLCIPKCQ